MIARRTALVCAVVLLVFAYLGDVILFALHITLNYIMIAGGAFIFVFAIKDAASEGPQETDAESKQDSRGLSSQVADRIAVFPLVIPLLAGPGTIERGGRERLNERGPLVGSGKIYGRRG
jgi:multiple antibiotic resistance protein